MIWTSNASSIQPIPRASAILVCAGRHCDSSRRLDTRSPVVPWTVTASRPYSAAAPRDRRVQSRSHLVRTQPESTTPMRCRRYRLAPVLAIGSGKPRRAARFGDVPLEPGSAESLGVVYEVQPPQSRAEAVQLVIESGSPVAEVAHDLGVSNGTLGNWVKAWRDANAEPETALSPIEQRVDDLGAGRPGVPLDGADRALA
ncbi:MAG: hypothetical protein DLM58_05105 [Pseudonocardiales bacterium]|nr:MAG: hypothetical protein DLM58_05105 [Pseudonocardiales bacterium]